ncbi:acetaldehyde dehydrogenase (acetylating) [Aneurinibacillus aneurinilyticus]|jgi:acetaldehyde dehydrogenase|uniref:Acetaldehyde dehydrogenase n=1 Tax=Aneurinibacillus aneurinilyticus TaxID=1391 RepID=A0A848CKJ1_ANEAE|nr:acetaldehyde dehydrogenase (acetylating) [Aneurinibacillus aneurinilyticus]MCI1696531.1 acetaldehyde dehydrogenase (acetylating) [Aneurinibacillus aneurinilyticus]MED0671681.1 acetaldehyde dehydrogenase (acetylating) [Aneurinibacillus aneurinilyticus]NME97814.1 acetaldehyde dehydrogenase (acetylating) [Aneurinibacillus aneurinilyticus]
MSKVKVAIIGSGNIGTDLMYKIERSAWLENSVMIGIDPHSEGLKRAREHGLRIFDNGIEGFLEEPELADIVFDATTAKAHVLHNQLLQEAGKKVIDLTPAAIGELVVPPVNLQQSGELSNVNMITCGGQATIPIVHAINRIVPVTYAEIVATVSSKSAGPGTRANIDEFTRTTAKGIEKIGGAQKGKAIIILNPAEPPIMMRDTIHVLIGEEGKEVEIISSIKEMVQSVQQYVPGYRLLGEPIFEGKKLSVFIEVEGAGDFFPPYSGNLDIMTAAAAKVGEELAKKQVAFVKDKG